MKECRLCRVLSNGPCSNLANFHRRRQACESWLTKPNGSRIPSAQKLSADSESLKLSTFESLMASPVDSEDDVSSSTYATL